MKILHLGRIPAIETIWTGDFTCPTCRTKVQIEIQDIHYCERDTHTYQDQERFSWICPYNLCRKENTINPATLPQETMAERRRIYYGHQY